MRVPVNRWTPERIGVTVLPGPRRRKNGLYMPSNSRFPPIFRVILVNRAGRLIPVLERHPRHRDALFLHLPAVVGEKEIEVLLFPVKNYRSVSVPAGKEAILCAAVHRIPGFQNNPKILHRLAPIPRDGRPHFRSRQRISPADPARFVVVPKKQRAVLVLPCRFKPHRLMIGGIEFYRFRKAQRELAGPPADRRNSSGMEEVQSTAGPERSAISINHGRQIDTRRRP